MRTMAGCGPVAREAAGGKSRSDGAVHPLRGQVSALCDVSRPIFPVSARVESAVVGVCPGRQFPSLPLPHFRQRTTRPTDHQLGGLLPTALEKDCPPIFSAFWHPRHKPKHPSKRKKAGTCRGARSIALPFIGAKLCCPLAARRQPARTRPVCSHARRSRVSSRRRPMLCRRLSPRSASQRGPSRSS